jgi:hypothetical protein
MADVAHEHQRAALAASACRRRAPGSAVGLQPAVSVGRPFEAGGEVALHQAEPVAVDADLVLGVDGGDLSSQSMIAVSALSSRTSATPAGSSCRSDGRGRSRSRRGGRGGRPARQPASCPRSRSSPLSVTRRSSSIFDIRRRRHGCRGQRRDLVEQGPAPGDHPGAALFIVAAGRRPVAERVGAVEGVVEAAPAGVGGVERVAGVVDRNDQLRAGDLGDLGIDAGGADREGRRRIDEIADLAEELLLLGGIAGRSAAERRVARVDPRLEVLAACEAGAGSRG